jgi:transposase
MADRTTRYPRELRKRVVRLVAEYWPDHATEWEAMRSVAQKLGIGSRSQHPGSPGLAGAVQFLVTHTDGEVHVSET